MLRKLRIVEGGDTGALPGDQLDVTRFTELNTPVLKEGKRPAVASPILLGITKASTSSESFLSAASFQETTRILTEASIKGKIDYLRGLKENVIIGKLLPAGTGLRGPLKSKEDLERERLELEERNRQMEADVEVYEEEIVEDFIEEA